MSATTQKHGVCLRYIVAAGIKPRPAACLSMSRLPFPARRQALVFKFCYEAIDHRDEDGEVVEQLPPIESEVQGGDIVEAAKTTEVVEGPRAPRR